MGTTIKYIPLGKESGRNIIAPKADPYERCHSTGNLAMAGSGRIMGTAVPFLQTMRRPKPDEKGKDDG